jgi:hypothetical protein
MLFIKEGCDLYRIGGDNAEQFLMSFFATIVYRLENNEGGSRFPKIMRDLYSGRLSIKNKKEAIEAIKEAHIIKGGLQTLPVNEIVWNKDNISQPIHERYKNNFIDNAYNFYIGEISRHIHIIDIILLTLQNCYKYGSDSVEIQIKNISFAKSKLLNQPNKIINIEQIKKGILLGSFYIPKDEAIESNTYDEVWESLYIGQYLNVFMNRGRAYDNDSIAIYNNEKIKLGYILYDRVILYALIENGNFLYGVIKQIDPQKQWINVNVFAKEHGEVEVKNRQKEFLVCLQWIFADVKVSEVGVDKIEGSIPLLKGQRLNLFRDKNHPNSKIAIEVKTEDDRHIGYIYYQLLAHLMDLGKNLFAKLSFVETYESNYSDYNVSMKIFMRQ